MTPPPRDRRLWHPSVPGSSARTGRYAYDVDDGARGLIRDRARWRRPPALLVNDLTLLPLVMALARRDGADPVSGRSRRPLPRTEFRRNRTDAERAQALEHRLAATANRSLVGVLNQFA